MTNNPENSLLPQSGEFPAQLVTFEIDDRMNLSAKEIGAAEWGMTLGWEQSGLVPTLVTVMFAERILIETETRVIEIDALYKEDVNTIVFGVSTVRERYTRTPLTQILLLLGAHEIAHKAQCQRGDPQSHCDLVRKPGTLTSRHEVEAAMISLCVFRIAFPTVPFDFSIGGYRYRTHPEPHCEVV